MGWSPLLWVVVLLLLQLELWLFGDGNRDGFALYDSWYLGETDSIDDTERCSTKRRVTKTKKRKQDKGRDFDEIRMSERDLLLLFGKKCFGWGILELESLIAALLLRVLFWSVQSTFQQDYFSVHFTKPNLDIFYLIGEENLKKSSILQLYCVCVKS